MPFFSVIIPTYNRGRFLHWCLDSVAAQTFADWECVVVDDGSTDGTEQVVGVYTHLDPRFRYCWQENGGVARARNRGMALATGDWVAFLDSDDRFLPWALHCYWHCAQLMPDVPIVSGRHIGENSPVVAPDFSDIRVERSDYFFGRGGPGSFGVVSVATRKSDLCRLGGFDQDLRTGEDSDFMLRLAALGDVAATACPVSVVCHPDEGKFARNIANGKRLDAEIRIHQRLPKDPVVLARLQDAPARLGEVQQYCARRVQVLQIGRLLRARDYAEAAAAFGTYWQSGPPLAETKLHCDRLFVHLYYPSSQPWRAAIQFSTAFRQMARQLSGSGLHDAAAFVEERLLSCAVVHGWARLHRNRDWSGLALLAAGTLLRPNMRAAIRLLRQRRTRAATPAPE